MGQAGTGVARRGSAASGLDGYRRTIPGECKAETSRPVVRLHPVDLDVDDPRRSARGAVMEPLLVVLNGGLHFHEIDRADVG